jgi:hypothetical protein
MHNSPTTLQQDTEASLARKREIEEQRRKRTHSIREESGSVRRESYNPPSPTVQRDTEASLARRREIEQENRKRSNPARHVRDTVKYPARDWERIRNQMRNNSGEKQSPFDIPQRNSSQHHRNQHKNIPDISPVISTKNVATQTAEEEIDLKFQSGTTPSASSSDRKRRHGYRKPRKIELRNADNSAKETEVCNNQEHENGNYLSAEPKTSNEAEATQENGQAGNFTETEQEDRMILMDPNEASMANQWEFNNFNEFNGGSANNPSGIGKWIDSMSGKLATLVKGSGSSYRDHYVHINHYLVLQNQVMYFQTECEKQRTELAELNYHNRRYEAEIQEFQKKSLRTIGKSTWTPLNDEVVINILEEIHNNIDDWADNCCLDSFERFEELDDKEQEGLMNFLCSVTQYPDVEDIQSMTELLERDMENPKLMASSYITHLMYAKLMSNPFDSIAILSTLKSSNNFGDGILLSQALSHIYQSILDSKSPNLN